VSDRQLDMDGGQHKPRKKVTVGDFEDMPEVEAAAKRVVTDWMLTGQAVLEAPLA
jgi:hypothetical protein